MNDEPTDDSAEERLEGVRDLIVACQATGLRYLPMFHMGAQSQITLPISEGVFVTVSCTMAGLQDIDPLLAAAREAFRRKRGAPPDDAELN